MLRLLARSASSVLLVLWGAAFLLAGCGDEPEQSTPSTGGATNGAGGAGAGGGGVGGVESAAGTGSTGAVGGAGGGGSVASTTAGSGGAGGGACAALSAEFDDKGCLTSQSAGEICGFASDGSVCELSTTCGTSSDEGQCKINCEMGTKIRCYKQQDVDCLASATCSGSCDALEACDWVL